MNFADQLRAMGVCSDAVKWVGTRTLRRAWNECERGDWMIWYAARILPPDHPALRQIAADCAERVWCFVPDKSKLACAWAIDCARRGADEDECRAAAYAADDAARAAGRVAARAVAAADDAADDAAAAAAANANAAAAAYAAADAATYAANANAAAAAAAAAIAAIAADAAADAAAYAAGRAAATDATDITADDAAADDAAAAERRVQASIVRRHIRAVEIEAKSKFNKLT